MQRLVCKECWWPICENPPYALALHTATLEHVQIRNDNKWVLFPPIILPDFPIFLEWLHYQTNYLTPWMWTRWEWAESSSHLSQSLWQGITTHGKRDTWLGILSVFLDRSWVSEIIWHQYDSIPMLKIVFIVILLWHWLSQVQYSLC